MELHDRLLNLRKERGMTQDDLAEALFVSRQTVYKWETGRALPDVNRLRQLCLLFDISADELLDIMPANKSAESEKEDSDADEDGDCDAHAALATALPRGRRRRWLIIGIIAAALLICALAAIIFTKPREIRQAAALGIVPEELSGSLSKPVSERELLKLLYNVSGRENGYVCEKIADALDTATNERMTREEAAYWLYCVHIWTKLDPEADLSIGGRETPDPVTQRDVYMDLNSAGQACADKLAAPWERSLCTELEATGALFDRYDGTTEMDGEINSILYGPYTTGVAFALGQISYFDDRQLMETEGGSFRPKELITAGEAISAAYRLFGSW